MNIRKWKDSPALKETRDMLETKLEDKKVRGILNWIFQIAVVLIFGILAGIALFQSVTVQESAMEPTLQVGERFFVNRAKTERTAGRRNKTEADGRYGTWANAGCSQSDFKRGQLFHRRNLKSDFKRRVFVSKRDNE